jgi:hypothetical protein
MSSSGMQKMSRGRAGAGEAAGRPLEQSSSSGSMVAGVADVGEDESRDGLNK